MSVLSDLLTTKTDLVWAVMVSALVSTGVSYWFKRRETRDTAEVEYEYQQRKKLRELIGRHHGRLLNAANSMNYRLWNLYENHQKGWLSTNGDFAKTGYYFRSSVYRFLNVGAMVRQLEAEAVLLDTRIARRSDFIFLNYASALHWVMTDAALTEGLPYDSVHQTDHFFSDLFRQYCDGCLRDGSFIGIEEFSKLLDGDSGLDDVLHYFDGLTRDETRLRWDRLVAFHLLILAFINSFGYKRQYTGQQQFVDAAKQIRNLRVLENLIIWLPRHDLRNDAEAKKIIWAAREVGRAAATDAAIDKAR